MKHSGFLPAVLTLCAATPATAQSLMMQHGEVVQAAGDTVPGTSGATVKASGLDSPVIDLDGNMFWRAQFENGDVTGAIDDRALFFGRTRDDLAIVVRSGGAEPSGSMPGVFLHNTLSSGSTSTGPSGTVRISPENGILMFGSNLSGAGVVGSGGTGIRNDSALFVGHRTSLQVLARRGDLAPSGGSNYKNTFGSPSLQRSAISSQGIAVFQADLENGDVTGTGDDDAWIIGVPGNLQWLIREGDPLLGGAVHVGTLGFNAQIDELGRVLHDEKLSTTLGTTPATTSDDETVMMYVPGGGNLIVVREGDPVPGIVGALFGSITLSGNCFSRRNGWMIFATTMTGSVSTTDDAALVAGTIGNLTVVAREGDPAPTGVPGDYFSVIYTSNATVCDDGVVCFLANVQNNQNPTNDVDDTCVFYGTPGNLTAIARDGDPIPDMPGFTISAPHFSAGVQGGLRQGTSNPAINERGHVLFSADVWDGVAGNNVTNQLAYHAATGLRSSIVGGESWTFGGSTQTVTNHSLQGFSSGDGTSTGFNNENDYCCRVHFTGGASNVALIRSHLGALTASTASVSTGAGGTQSLSLDAGVAHAGKAYLLAGSITGTRPGFDVLGMHVPLNLDFYFAMSTSLANTALYPNSIGVLDASGHASAAFTLPSGFPSLQGIRLHHAFVVLNPTQVALDFVSEPLSVHLF